MEKFLLTRKKLIHFTQSLAATLTAQQQRLANHLQLYLCLLWLRRYPTYLDLFVSTGIDELSVHHYYLHRVLRARVVGGAQDQKVAQRGRVQGGAQEASALALPV